MRGWCFAKSTLPLTLSFKEEGFEIVPDEKGVLWFFERYGCPRFTAPDEKGNIILDICYFLNNIC